LSKFDVEKSLRQSEANWYRAWGKGYREEAGKLGRRKQKSSRLKGKSHMSSRLKAENSKLGKVGGRKKITLPPIS
jgi:hypothetical protein